MKYTQPVRGSPPAAGTTTSYGPNWQELSGIKNGSSFCFAKCRKVKVSPKPQRQNPSDLPEAAERQEILRFVGNDLRTTE